MVRRSDNYNENMKLKKTNRSRDRPLTGAEKDCFILPKDFVRLQIQTLVDGRTGFVGVWTHPLTDVLSVNNLHHVDIYKGAQPVLSEDMVHGAVNV